MTPDGWVLGIDVGGTKVRAGLADQSGAIVAERVEPTCRADGDAVVAQLVRMGRDLGDARLTAVGVGVPGVYDAVADRVSASDNLPALGEVGLAERLSEAFGAPVIVDNDVNLAALAEQRWGHAVGMRDFVTLAVGTGLGLGIVIGGRLYRGSRGAAGEIDRLPVGAPGRTRGLEGLLSGPALRARSGDVDAEAAAMRAAYAAAVVCCILDPELVVFAGGIGTLHGLAAAVRRHLDGLLRTPPAVLPSAFGAAAGMYGAVAVALDRAATPVGSPA